MKKIAFILFFQFACCAFLSAQVPGKINYQAVIRNSTGELISNQDIGIRISVLNETADGVVLYSESHAASTNETGQVSIQIGNGTLISGDFNQIDWGTLNKFLKVEVDVSGGTSYVSMGTTQLLTVPYAFYADNAMKADQLGTEGVYSTNTDTLFVVKDHNGNVVFAVFPDGAQVIVNETAKGKVGGFAVSGRSPSKATDVNILNITLDSTRIYVNDTVNAKGKVGGFAVSGRSPSKATSTEILYVTADSTRIFVNEDNIKAKVGGFAVSGRSPSKGTETDFFNISGSNVAEIINPSEAKILWYPNKEAFLTGRVLIESPDSVGYNSMATGFESKAIGGYSQALGYKARAKGVNSTAIGNNSNANGIESYALGNSAQTEGTGSYAFGSGAKASGIFSFALGSTGVDDEGLVTRPTKAVGDYAYAFGMGSVALDNGSFAFGTQDTASGKFCTAMGVRTKASALYATAMGAGTLAEGQASTAMGALTTASGNYSTAMGQQTLASNNASVAMGLQTEASGFYSTAMGWSTTASGDNSVAMGFSTQAKGTSSFAMGYETLADTNFAIALGFQTIANGIGSIAMGYVTVADTAYSTALGYQTNASGFSSVAMGRNSIASGDYSLAMGWGTESSNSNSIAFGYTTVASGWASTALGYGTTASGNISMAIGNGIEAAGDYSFGIGLNAATNEIITDNNTMAIMGGELGIGTISPDKLLHVAGDVRIEGDIYYGTAGTSTTYSKPDYVFSKQYERTYDINSVSEFISAKGHLPWLTSAEEEINGINITRMTFETLEAVENQQLQIISLKEENETLKTEIIELKQRLNEIIELLDK